MRLLSCQSPCGRVDGRAGLEQAVELLDVCWSYVQMVFASCAWIAQVDAGVECGRLKGGAL